MKHLLLTLLTAISLIVNAQQSGSLAGLLPGSGKHFGLDGIGSLNTESFNNVNGSGKLSGYMQLLHKNNHRYSLTTHLSFNRNATNNDSTLASTLLFPDIGKSSFIGTLNYIFRQPNSNHYIGFFGQGSFKTIKGHRKIKQSERDTALTFAILDWQLGIRYFNTVYSVSPDKVIFSASAFLNFYNIPDEDNGDYRYIYDNEKMPSSFPALGVKICLEINRLQLFADFRQIYGSDKKVPDRDLRGFNLNIGVIFNADFYEN